MRLPHRVCSSSSNTSSNAALVAQEQSTSLVRKRSGCDSRRGLQRTDDAQPRAAPHKGEREGATPSVGIGPHSRASWIVNRTSAPVPPRKRSDPPGLGCKSSAIRQPNQNGE